jgi:hypothetical protein
LSPRQHLGLGGAKRAARGVLEHEQKTFLGRDPAQRRLALGIAHHVVDLGAALDERPAGVGVERGPPEQHPLPDIGEGAGAGGHLGIDLHIGADILLGRVEHRPVLELFDAGAERHHLLGRRHRRRRLGRGFGRRCGRFPGRRRGRLLRRRVATEMPAGGLGRRAVRLALRGRL